MQYITHYLALLIMLQPCNIYLGNYMKYFIDWVLSLFDDAIKQCDEYIDKDYWGI